MNPRQDREMTEAEARATAKALNDQGVQAIATHAGRTRQDQLPSKE